MGEASCLQQPPAGESGIDLMPVADARSLSQPPAEVNHPLISPGREIDQSMIETLYLDPLVVEMFHTRRELCRQVMNAGFQFPRLGGVPIQTHRSGQLLQLGERRVELDFTRPDLH